MRKIPCGLYSCFLLLFALGGHDHGLVQAQEVEVVIDAYPNTAVVDQGITQILVCRVVGVPFTTVLSYQWTCPGGYCDAGAVDPERAVRIQQGNILVVNVRNGSDNGTYTCTVVGDSTQQMGTASYTFTVTYGLTLLNEDGGLRVFFPRNSFVTNTTLTHTINPRGQTGGAPRGNDHIVCYVSYKSSATVIWYNNSGVKLEDCGTEALCGECGDKCVRNGGVGVDGALVRRTHIHMYTDSPAYVNQDLECKVLDWRGPSAFIGVYLKDGVSTTLQPPSSITQRATTTTAVNVSWSQVSGATGYYVSYQRQDLGAPPVVTPQYERILGRHNTSVTLSGLEPGTTYRIRVWSTDGTSVSSETREMDVTTMESAPSPPRMLTNVTMTGDPNGIIIELNWLPPLHPNGAIHYEIEYEPAMTPGDRVNTGSSSPYFNLTLPNEFMAYNVSVIARNTQGQATSHSITIQTEKMKVLPPTVPMPAVIVTGNIAIIIAVVSATILILLGSILVAVVSGVICRRRRKKHQGQKYNPKAVATTNPCDCQYKVDLDTIGQPEQPRNHASKVNTFIVESEYSYAEIPERWKQPEPHQGQASKIPKEEYDDIEEKECHPCQPASNKACEPTKGTGTHVYSAVVKNSKKKSHRAVATQKQCSEEMLEPVHPTHPSHVLPPPAQSGPYKGTRKPTEQRRGQASKVVPIEEDYDDICMKEKECHPCQPVLTSTKESPQQTKVADKQVYSAVVKKSKKSNTDEN